MDEFKVGQQVRIKLDNPAPPTGTTGRIIGIDSGLLRPYVVEFKVYERDFDGNIRVAGTTSCHFAVSEIKPADTPPASDDIIMVGDVPFTRQQYADLPFGVEGLDAPVPTSDDPQIAADSKALDELRAFIESVRDLPVDALSPIEALTKLYELKRKAAAALKSID